MTFLAIDPGSAQSAWLEYDTANSGGKPVGFAIESNSVVLHRLRHMEEDGIGWPKVDRVVCEWMAPRGMPTSAQEFETLFFIGRFCEAAVHLPFIRLKRSNVKSYLCGNMAAKDSNIRAALIDRYGGTGGKRAAVGLKAQPGPLYGVSNDVWAALAVAVTFAETS